MNDLRNQMNKNVADNPAGDILEEMKAAELEQVSAGAGAAVISSGVVCTLTAECYYGTFLKRCCPK